LSVLYGLAWHNQPARELIQGRHTGPKQERHHE